MTPEEKSQELIEKFFMADTVLEVNNMTIPIAKQCAIICVEEMLKTLGGVWADIASSIARNCQDTQNHIEYWQQVLNYLKTK